MRKGRKTLYCLRARLYIEMIFFFVHICLCVCVGLLCAVLCKIICAHQVYVQQTKCVYPLYNNGYLDGGNGVVVCVCVCVATICKVALLWYVNVYAARRELTIICVCVCGAFLLVYVQMNTQQSIALKLSAYQEVKNMQTHIHIYLCIHITSY